MLEAVVAGDATRVAAQLHGLSESERRAVVPELLGLLKALRKPSHYTSVLDASGQPQEVEWADHRGWETHMDQERAVHTGLLASATLSELRRARITFVAHDDALAILLDRRPPWMQEWVELYDGWALGHELVTRSLIERPTGYYAGLLRQSASWALATYPELLEHDVWALLNYVGEDSLRAADDNGGSGWADALLACAADGRLPRARLLDATLDALAGDIDAYRAVWFTRFWRALAPTREERRERAERLAAVLAAPAASAVSFAVTELLRDDAAVPTRELAPALAAGPKGTALKALRLLDRAPDAEAAVVALAHVAPEVQAAALDRLERWGVEPAALEPYFDGLAATQRPRALALLDGTPAPAVQDEAVDVSGIPEAIRLALNFGGPVPEAPVAGEPVLGAPMAPISLAEAAHRVGTALVDHEAPEHEDEWLLDALLRCCDEPTAWDGPLRPFATRLDDRWSETVLAVAAAWRSGQARARFYEPGLWERRLLAAERRAAAGQSAPLLALPTHAGGWIEPVALVERLRTVGDTADEDELAQAILRLAPEGRATALAAASDLPGRAGAALRCALGGARVDGDRADELVARHVRVPALEPRLGVEVRVWDIPDYEYDHRDWIVTASPVDEREPLSQLGARAAGHDFRTTPLDWPARRDLACAEPFGRYGQCAPLLLTLLPSSEPLPPLALRLALVSLAHQDEVVRLAATDLLIAAIDDGRADAPALIPHLREDLPLLLTNRLTPRFTDIAATGVLHAVVVRDALAATIDVVTKRPGPLRRLLGELEAQTEGVDPAPLLLAAQVRRAQRWIG
ncbi:hypothetical protein C8N24_1414 [Solirubrobacter pauli]|uniref:HEAT repeat protein n=1 Tax=Solirubrobacter pauli TaxID=166793 RepID=A0A660LFV5_9ACTN|nr:DUF6493 family protein [Solirubrobacter pauli]RKQ91591.1 hypothetical protein C8N24_1414 [Solirubrobacter pauli]